MTYQEMMENAKLSMGLYCKACPVCDGRACKNQIPGPGAKGVGDTAIRNYKKWQEIRVNMDTICDGGETDTSVNLFGKEFKMPFFAGPVGAVNLHYSDRYDDVSYNNVLVSACADAGIAAFTGDGVNAKVMEAATEAIRENDGIDLEVFSKQEDNGNQSYIIYFYYGNEKYESAGRKQECTGAFRDCEDGWKTIYRQRRDDSERREKSKRSRCRCDHRI